MKGRRRGRASEELAARLLEARGLRVTGRRVRVRLGGVDVAEVDLVAEGGGERYAVEVKAGCLDVTGVRQAYVNAKLLGAKPMVVTKGFCDAAAEELARALGVEVVQLSDIFLVEPEELWEAVREATWSALAEVLSWLALVEPSSSDVEVLRVLAESGGPDEAASKLGVNVSELSRILSELRGRRVLPPSLSGGWDKVRAAAGAALLAHTLRRGCSCGCSSTVRCGGEGER